MTWQPMTTAPKHRHVLLLDKHSDNDKPAVRIGYWCVRCSQWELSHAWFKDNTNSCHPVAWQPLPEIPTKLELESLTA